MVLLRSLGNRDRTDMKYAARVLDLMEELDAKARAMRSRNSRSREEHKKPLQNGAEIFRKLAETVRVTPKRVAAISR